MDAVGFRELVEQVRRRRRAGEPGVALALFEEAMGRPDLTRHQRNELKLQRAEIHRGHRQEEQALEALAPLLADPDLTEVSESWRCSSR